MLKKRIEKLEESNSTMPELSTIPADATLKQAQRIYSDNLRILALMPTPKLQETEMTLEEATAIYRKAIG